jgi:hypothetical protein
VRLPVCAVRGGPLRYQAILGPFPPDAHRLGLRFHCEHLGCNGLAACCRDEEVMVPLGRPRTGG